jgi:peptidoglycan hydrolase-like protein with peptidoglycan-binding domain
MQVSSAHRPTLTNVAGGDASLRPGSRGAAVEHVQRLLNQKGAHLGVDGDFGDNTARAVKHFQSTHGLRATGVVNDVTGRGRHTSSSAVALALPDDDGWIIDTPGIRSFGLAHVDVGRVIEAFPDLQVRLPSGLNAKIAYDATAYIEDALKEIVKTLLETLLIVSIVIFLQQPSCLFCLLLFS